MGAGRFAPSPSGPLHIGNLRTALLAWLFARSEQDRFWLRMEDLDPGSSRAEVAEGQLRDLGALGIDWDGDVVWQSGRRSAHQDAIAVLENRGLLYECYCTRREIREAARADHGTLPEGAYPGTCRNLSSKERSRRRQEGRPPALRLRSRGEPIVVNDRLSGPTRGGVDDMVVRRNDGTPAYNLAVVVDDDYMGITQVVRGDDLLPSTPRQVHVARLLGLTVPEYAHVPLVLGPDGGRLSKRHGAMDLGGLSVAGVGPAEVRRMFAFSLGLAAQGEAVPDTACLLERFDPASLPGDPWVVDAQWLAGGSG